VIPSTSKTSPEKKNPGQIKLSILLKLTSLIFTPPEVTNSSPNGPLPEIIYLSLIRIFIIFSLSSAIKSDHFFTLSIPILFNKKIHNLFVNSGTEACMAVLRLMRAFTGRDKVIKFDGCYHGHADMFLVKAGSGVATLGLPDSPGVPRTTTANTLTAPYNDLEAVKKLFSENPDAISGVMLEPIVGNAGFITPEPGFLEGLRELTTENGSLLVFDEVMTGFRISYGGAQEKFGVTPDLTTLGKVIGGGLPVGAYGGKKEIMSMVAPSGPVYQAGTLSGNPLAMTAGIKTLELLKQEGTYEKLEATTSRLIEGIIQSAENNGIAINGGNVSAMFGFFLCDGPVRNFDEAKTNDAELFGKLHREMLRRGIYLAPSPFEAGFTSLAHSEEEIDKTIEAFDESFNAIKK